MPKFAYTSRACRKIDVLALEHLGLSEIQLMQKAASSLFDKMRFYWPDAKHIQIYCGPGNNGGDGYLLAVKALQAGIKVAVFAVSAPKSNTARAALNLALHYGIKVSKINNNTAREETEQVDLLVDALFGHGLKRDISESLISLFKRLNKSFIPVFAVDMPSGINSDTGAVMGAALHAARTHSLVAPKLGMFTAKGQDYAGVISHDDLGIPAQVFSQVRSPYAFLSRSAISKLLPNAASSSHKGHFGHVAVVGGQPGMFGAVILAASAAARSGAGKVTAQSYAAHIDAISQANPVLMTQPVTGEAQLSFPDDINAIVLGPGLGIDAQLNPNKKQENWSRKIFLASVQHAMEQGISMVIDADALNLMAHQIKRYEQWVLTPHPKEAARLLHCAVAEVQSDRVAACRQIAKIYGGVCVLKGNGSLISAADGMLTICQYGNWGMATAGSGDVLSGVVGAFLGLGLSPYHAAYAAVYVHSRAGDIAAKRLSKRSMIASDIIECLSSVFANIEKR
jgi:NAD(P)H-hydrate epimerase